MPCSRFVSIRLWAACFFVLFPLACRAAPPAQTVFLPSAKPSGIAVNDRIPVTFYPAQGTETGAVVLIHPAAMALPLLDVFLEHLARRLTSRGIACALVPQPYHLGRRAPHDGTLHHFFGPDAAEDVRTISQAASDINTVAAWLAARPGANPARIGAIGISLGAITLHLAMSGPTPIKAGVALLGGGDLPDLYRHSVYVRIAGLYAPDVLTPQVVNTLKAVDPLSFADVNRPRRVFMLAGARDLYVPPHTIQTLWEALGHPPMQWVDTGHFSLFVSDASVARTSIAYLTRVWDGLPDDPNALPHIYAPTFKVGILSGLDSHVTPALTWQAYSFASRHDHLSLLHLDAGLSGRGLFAGAAFTLTPYIDIGAARRLGGQQIRPYLSLHVVL